jgi:restriction system protein
LVQNWKQTELGKDFDIFEEDGELVGQQYQSDTGPMDILAIKKDKSQLLVVELKKGRASDAVVGQVLRYMGYVKQELAEPNQSVKGVIIALDDDTRIRRALAMTPDRERFLADPTVQAYINEQSILDTHLYELVKATRRDLLSKSFLQTPSGRPSKSKILAYLSREK